jgi:hypothetical protein
MLVLGLLLAAGGLLPLIRESELLGLKSDTWLLMAAFLAFGLCLFAFLSRLFAYVQVREGYLLVATMFLRLKISYRRLLSLHPVLLQQLFPPEALSWAQRNYLEPFYGKTALVVQLRAYPMAPAFLRFFLPAQMFSPRSTGIVLLVSDWMKLSTEFDSIHGAWLQTQGARMRSDRNSY